MEGCALMRNSCGVHPMSRWGRDVLGIIPAEAPSGAERNLGDFLGAMVDDGGAQ